MDAPASSFSPAWDRALELLLRFLGAVLAAIAVPASVHYAFGSALAQVPAIYFQVVALGMPVLGLARAAYWTWREDALNTARLHSLCQTVVRYFLAYIFVTYGLAKLYRTQLYEPPLLWQDTPVGELSGFMLTWTFFGTSFAYAAFIGVSQLVCAALLCFRKTQLVGALALLPIIGNIVFVNFAYGVPVKFFSTLFLAMTAYLVLADARRLKAFFWDQRAAVPPPRREAVLRRPRLRRGLKALTILAIGGFCLWYFETATAKSGRVERPVYGTWEVISFDAGGDGPNPSAADWEQIIFAAHRGGEDAYVKTDGRRRHGTYAVDAERRTLTLDLANGPTFEGRYRDLSGERLRLAGRLNGDSLAIRLRRTNE